MNLPTQHQLVVLGTHVAGIAAGAVSALAFAGVLSQAQVGDATSDIKRIWADLQDLYGAAAGLVGLGLAAYGTVKSGPFASLFRAATEIASDPAKMAQLKTSTLNEQAPLVAVTDKLPDVANVGTMPTKEGVALATAVPSLTVQSVSPTPPAAKAV